MSYIGAKPLTAEHYFDVFNGDGVTTSFVTTLAAASPVSVIVTVNGTIVDPEFYFFQGNTINFFTAPSVGTRNIQLRYLSVPTSGVSAPSTYRQVDEFTAIDGQTTFNVRYYDLGYVDVFVNGVQLGNDDYQASDNQTIILQVPARNGDFVRIVSAYNTVLTKNYYNQTANTVLIGNGSSSFKEVSPGNTGNILVSNGINWNSTSTLGNVTINGTTSTTSVPGTIWNYDASSSNITLTVGQTVAFSHFSGSVLVNCYNSGTVSQYLCGGGGAPICIGSSKVTQTGTMSSTSGISGYTFTATEAGVHSFYVIRTRTGA